MVNVSNESMTWDDDDIRSSTYALKPLDAPSPRAKDEYDQSLEGDLRSSTNPFPTTLAGVGSEVTMGRNAESTSSANMKSIVATVHACEGVVSPPFGTTFSPSSSSSSANTIAGGARRRRTTAGRNIGRGGGSGGSYPMESREGGDGGRGGGDEGVGGGRGRGEREKKSGDTRKGFATNLGFISGMDTSNVDERGCGVSISGEVASFKKGIDGEEEEAMVRGGGNESHEEDDAGAIAEVREGEFHGRNADDLVPNTGGLMGESLGGIGTALDIASNMGRRDEVNGEVGEELEMVHVERVLTVATTAEEVSLSV